MNCFCHNPLILYACMISSSRCVYIYIYMYNFVYLHICLHVCMHLYTPVCMQIYRSKYMWVSAWASYQIRKIAGCACAGNAGNVFPRRRFQRELLVSDPGMHHGTCVTHVPWCMSGSLTCGDGENVPGIPGACAPAILRIWQEAHALMFLFSCASVYQHPSIGMFITCRLIVLYL